MYRSIEDSLVVVHQLRRSFHPGLVDHAETCDVQNRSMPHDVIVELQARLLLVGVGQLRPGPRVVARVVGVPDHVAEEGVGHVRVPMKVPYERLYAAPPQGGYCLIDVAIPSDDFVLAGIDTSEDPGQH